MRESIDVYTVLFYFFVSITLVSACVVVFSRHIVRSAFALLFTFFGVAALYVYLFADFLAITQLLVYVGGILVLILFGVMLTNKQINVDIKTGTLHIVPAIILAAAIGGTLVGIAWSNPWMVLPTSSSVKTTAPQIGELLLTTYLLPFEVASMVLMVALVGAVVIARREKNKKETTRDS
ncbi:MAG: NADH-quinone oxidoreductase subunit J [Bacteroidetes bacterium]|nr:NADH-quinone oxidoreductase subunit J [Bacteroidota bacterium]